MMTRSARRLIVLGLLLLVLVVVWRLRPQIRDYAATAFLGSAGKAAKTVEDRLSEFGDAARARWSTYFESAGRSYPPGRTIMVAFKDVGQLEVYAAGTSNPPVLIRTIKILADSGGPGPKLREGDEQIPEGIYPIESLNPNSSFHVSLRVGYPNAYDRQQAGRDGRSNLGGDIMIHGSSVSIGCLAVGDEAAEDLFVLAADAGIANVKVVICPTDLRVKEAPVSEASQPAWYPELTAQLRQELDRLPIAPTVKPPKS